MKQRFRPTINVMFALIFGATMTLVVVAAVLLYFLWYVGLVEDRLLEEAKVRHISIASDVDTLIFDQQNRLARVAQSGELQDAVQSGDEVLSVQALDRVYEADHSPIDFLFVAREDEILGDLSLSVDNRSQIIELAKIDFQTFSDRKSQSSSNIQIYEIGPAGEPDSYLFYSEPVIDQARLYAVISIRPDSSLFRSVNLTDEEFLGLEIDGSGRVEGLKGMTPSWLNTPEVSLLAPGVPVLRGSSAVSVHPIFWATADQSFSLVIVTSGQSFLGLLDSMALIGLVCLVVAIVATAGGFVIGSRVIGGAAQNLVAYTRSAPQHPDTGLVGPGTIQEFDTIADEVHQMVRSLRTAEAALERGKRQDALGHVISGVAHDFNNILAVMLGSLDLVRLRIGDDPATLDLVEMAIDAGESGRGVTRQLQVTSGKSLLDPRSFELCRYLNQRKRGLEEVVGSNCSIHVECSAHFWARIDPDLFGATLLNLVLNAERASATTIKFMVERPQFIPEYIDSSTDQVVTVRVQDNGHGVDVARADEIFEPFYTTDRLHGSGLGLAMARGFLGQSGGGIELNKDFCCGAEFIIYVPVISPQAEEEVDAFVARPMRMAVVDDDEMVRGVLIEMLRSLGHEVMSFDGFESFVSIGDEIEKLDVILTDLLMPGSSGEDVHRFVRSKFGKLPIIIVSGDQISLEVGARDTATLHLVKPIRSVDLMTALSWVETVGKS